MRMRAVCLLRINIVLYLTIWRRYLLKVAASLFGLLISLINVLYTITQLGKRKAQYVISLVFFCFSCKLLNFSAVTVFVEKDTFMTLNKFEINKLKLLLLLLLLLWLLLLLLLVLLGILLFVCFLSSSSLSWSINYLIIKLRAVEVMLPSVDQLIKAIVSQKGNTSVLRHCCRCLLRVLLPSLPGDTITTPFSHVPGLLGVLLSNPNGNKE